MGKMFNATALLLAIEVSLILFKKQTTATNFMYDFFINPTNWSNGTWIPGIAVIILGLAGATIIAGAVFFKYDFIVFASFMLPLLSLGLVVTDLFTFINSELSSIMGVASLSTGISLILSAIPCGILAVWYTFVCLEFWRSPNG